MGACRAAMDITACAPAVVTGLLGPDAVCPMQRNGSRRSTSLQRGDRLRASAYRYLEVTASRRKVRGKRRRGSDGGSDDDDGLDSGSGGNWNNGGNWSGWSGGHGDYSGYSGGEWFSNWERMFYEWGLAWHLVCAASLLNAGAFLVTGQRKTVPDPTEPQQGALA